MGSIVGGLLLIFAVYDTGYQAGYDRAENEYIEQSHEDLRLLLLESEELQEDISFLDTVYVSSKKELELKITKLEDEINGYDAKSPVADCERLSDEWMRLHDNAAALSKNSITTASRMAIRASGGVKNIETLKVITHNYALCALQKKQLEALQDYVKLLLSP